MKVTITEIFCEILSGIFLFFVLFAYLDWFRIVEFNIVLEAAKTLANVEVTTAVLVGAYLVGILLDSVGLVFDDCLGKCFYKEMPTSNEMAKYWKNVEPHVLAYRDNIWAYYFCYQNIFILVPLAIIGCLGALCSRGQNIMALVAVVMLILFEIILYYAMKVLLKLYYDLPKYYKQSK